MSQSFDFTVYALYCDSTISLQNFRLGYKLGLVLVLGYKLVLVLGLGYGPYPKPNTNTNENRWNLRI